MRNLIRYSLQDLAAHWKLGLAMILLIGLSILFFLTIGGYRLTLTREYANVPDAHLIVQESNTLGELYGSRIPAEVAAQLREMGVSWSLPEIHDMAGTSVGDMLMLRGVDPVSYQQINPFKLLSGQPLTTDNPPRSAMLGRRLAEKFGLAPGQEILIRGRKFVVCGIFHTGTYADNEAWVALADAQALLGWGSDVSLFIIPDEGILQPGDQLPGGLSVAHRGQGAYTSISQITPLLNAMDIVVRSLAVAAVFALTNTLIRLAWLRRRELAILRCVGFQSTAIILYLLSQASFLSISGALLGIGGSAVIFTFLHADLSGMNFTPRLDLGLALATLLLAMTIGILGTVLPAVWINRVKLPNLLRNET